jgi:hypothetical protein
LLPSRVRDGWMRRASPLSSPPMGTTFHYANLTKREWFSAGAFGENDKLSGLGRSLSSRVFNLLLVGGGDRTRGGRVVELGYWAGDSVVLVGDEGEDWCRYRDEFVDLDADVILLVHSIDGFADIAVAAETSDTLFVQLCHLVVTRQAVRLEPDLKQRFGADFLRRYKQLCEGMKWFEPKKLGRPAGN